MSKQPIDKQLIDELNQDEDETVAMEDDTTVEVEEDLTFNTSLYSYMRRTPHHKPPAKNELYISNNGKFIHYIRRSIKLLQIEGNKEIIIHGLGAAIMPAIKLSLYLQKKLPDISIAPTTSTEEILDQFDPNVDNLDPVTKIRHCSAIHIKVIQNTK